MMTHAMRVHATATLKACCIALGANFYTLTPSQVDELLTHADAFKYRKPKNANGSRARYFHALMQKRAERAR